MSVWDITSKFLFADTIRAVLTPIIFIFSPMGPPYTIHILLVLRLISRLITDRPRGRDDSLSAYSYASSALASAPGPVTRIYIGREAYAVASRALGSLEDEIQHDKT